LIQTQTKPSCLKVTANFRGFDVDGMSVSCEFNSQAKDLELGA